MPKDGEPVSPAKVGLTRVNRYPVAVFCRRRILPSPDFAVTGLNPIVYQLHGLANHGLKMPKIHWIEG
jgi:hypothetical protein